MSTPAPLEAVRKTLADYLATQNAGVTVSPRWPTPQRPLPAKAITVVLPPAPPVVREHPPRVWSFTATSSTAGDVLYSYGLAEIGLQLDVWAQYPAVRDQLAASVQGQINRPPSATLGLTTLPRLSRAPGLVLRCTEFYDVPVDYRFEPIPPELETSDRAQKGDWRATWQGKATVHLLSQESVAIMTQLVLQLATNGGAASDVPIFP